MTEVQTQTARIHWGEGLIFLALALGFVGLGAALREGVLPAAPGVLIFVLTGWIVAVCLHEFGHAITAYWGGDHTIAEKGYLTLNPIRYTNLVYSIALPLVFLALGGIGLPGAAVYLRPDLIRTRVMRSLASLAGPAMSFLAGLAFAAPFALGLHQWDMAPGAPAGAEAFWSALALLAYFQFMGTLLNLMPIPGLDGYGVLQPFLPPALAKAIRPIAGIAVIAFLMAAFLAPGLLRPLFVAAVSIADAFGVPRALVVFGLDLLQFWR